MTKYEHIDYLKHYRYFNHCRFFVSLLFLMSYRIGNFSLFMVDNSTQLLFKMRPEAL